VRGEFSTEIVHHPHNFACADYAGGMTTSSANSATSSASNDPAFVEVISLIAALEGQPRVQAEVLLLSGLGMARAELTDYGHRLPGHLHALNPVEVEEGLATLMALLSTMLEKSEQLAHTLRIQAALRILVSVETSPRSKSRHTPGQEVPNGVASPIGDQQPR